MKIKIPEYIVQRKYENKNIIFQLGFKETEIGTKKNEDGYIIENLLEEDILLTNGNKRYMQYKYVLKYKDEILNENTEVNWYRFCKENNPKIIKNSYDSNYKIEV